MRLIHVPSHRYELPIGDELGGCAVAKPHDPGIFATRVGDIYSGIHTVSVAIGVEFKLDDQAIKGVAGPDLVDLRFKVGIGRWWSAIRSSATYAARRQKTHAEPEQHGQSPFQCRAG